jgi:predicted CopG family antitoxin
MKYRTISVREEIYNILKERAVKGFRGISNQLELELYINSND